MILFLLGVALLGIALGAWLVGDETTTTTVSEGSTVTVTSTGAAAEGTTTGQAASPTNAGSETRSNKTTVTTNPPSRPSETLIGAVVAFGVALVLVGMYFNRLQSIKAGGVELTLQAKVAEKLAAKTPTTEDPEEQERIRKAYLLAVSQIPPGTSSGDDAVIEAVTRDAASTVGVDFE